ncbi:MAG: penicillin-binding protein [Myxococcales bacterium]|nr:transpeptidase family protein [Polyangiaceae bacterium]MDW8247895.1 penicillin-binding protein [Myxococcales bacterium]
MKNLDPERARWIRVRMGVLCGLMGLGCGLLVSSAYKLQIEDGAAWREMAEAQRQRRMHVAPKRGTILDRNGVSLAVSVEVPSISADAFEMLRLYDAKALPDAVRRISGQIAKALSLDANEVANKIRLKRRFVWLKRRVSAEEVEAIRALGDPKRTANPIRGLQIEGEGQRYYPNRDLAGPLLGFVAPDGEGKEGLELQMEEELRGHAEEVKGLRDRSGRLLFAEGVSNEKALAGHSVYLSIDQGIQYIAEQELSSAVRTYEAVGGSVVVVDPATGELLAMASNPQFNPNDYRKSPPEHYHNRAIYDRFEPGSTMKVFTVAAALAARTLTPTQQIYCEKGSMAIDNVVIHDTHISEWLTPTQLLAVSSNIGAAKIGIELGEAKLYEAFRRFGFGEPTGIPLPGEAGGVLRSRGRPWVQVETAAASFGQGVSVTTLQLGMAISAIANGGKLMEPILVKRVVDGQGNLVREYTPRVRREVVPPHVARTVAEMLVAVTEGEGTGIEAAFQGFKVAGKTATAQKVDPQTGRYTQDRFTSSFLGFVPADRPRIAIVVVIDEPMVSHAGGTVAAPVFRRIAEFSLRYLGVKPEGSGDVSLANVGREAAAAASGSAAAPGPGVPWRTVAPPVAPDLPVIPVNDGPSATLPVFVGMPARDALRTAYALGVAPSILGSGVVARQEPSPGTIVPRGTVVRLFLEPPG